MPSPPTPGDARDAATASPIPAHWPRPLVEVRYRLTQPPDVPLPFAPWFDSAPRGRVHGVRLRVEGDEGRGTLLALAGDGDVDALRRRIDETPPPGTTDLDLRARRDAALEFAYRWREPIHPGVASPMKVARDVLGPEARISYTLARDDLVHRVLVPPHALDDALWTRLRDELMRYAGFAKAPVTLALERYAPLVVRELAPSPEAWRVFEAAFDVGLFDDPSHAGVGDVAAAAALPEAEARRRLGEVDRAVLREPPGRD